jgi:hypothetical protein
LLESPSPNMDGFHCSPTTTPMPGAASANVGDATACTQSAHLNRSCHLDVMTSAASVSSGVLTWSPSCPVRLRFPNCLLHRLHSDLASRAQFIVRANHHRTPPKSRTRGQRCEGANFSPGCFTARSAPDWPAEPKLPSPGKVPWRPTCRPSILGLNSDAFNKKAGSRLPASALLGRCRHNQESLLHRCELPGCLTVTPSESAGSACSYPSAVDGCPTVALHSGRAAPRFCLLCFAPSSRIITSVPQPLAQPPSRSRLRRGYNVSAMPCSPLQILASELRIVAVGEGTFMDKARR